MCLNIQIIHNVLVVNSIPLGHVTIMYIMFFKHLVNISYSISRDCHTDNVCLSPTFSVSLFYAEIIIIYVIAIQ